MLSLDLARPTRNGHSNLLNKLPKDRNHGSNKSATGVATKESCDSVIAIQVKCASGIFGQVLVPPNASQRGKQFRAGNFTQAMETA